MKDEVLKTGTTTVGIIAKNCIVLAADKRATAGHFIAGKKVDKIHAVDDKIALTTAGSVSDIQLLVKLIRAELTLKRLRNNRSNGVKEAANLLSGMVYGIIRRLSMVPSIVHFLFAGYDSDGLHLYDIYPDGSITEIDDFVASGSGSTFAYGVFDAQYKKDMSQEEAVNLALKGINSALQRDSASGDGLDVVIITKDGVKKHLTRELTIRV